MNKKVFDDFDDPFRDGKMDESFLRDMGIQQQEEKHENLAFAEHDPLKPGKMFRYYFILRKIGQGGMGEVCLAVDTSKNRQVAIKRLTKSCSKNSYLRFKQEYKFLKAIHHPNLIRAYDYFEDYDYFITMEFVPGKSLQKLLVDNEKLLLIEKLAIAAKVCRGVEVLNTAGIIHRDIKPSNIMVNKKAGVVKILDLGLGKDIRQSPDLDLSLGGAVMGTAPYLSPEQTLGRVSDTTDIFSLGTTLYQLFTETKESPFYSPNMHRTCYLISTHHPPPIEDFVKFSQHERQMYHKISQIIFCAMEKKPENRWRSAGQMADAFVEMQQQVVAAMPDIDMGSITSVPEKISPELKNSLLQIKKKIQHQNNFLEELDHAKLPPQKTPGIKSTKKLKKTQHIEQLHKPTDTVERKDFAKIVKEIIQQEEERTTKKRVGYVEQKFVAEDSKRKQLKNTEKRAICEQEFIPQIDPKQKQFKNAEKAIYNEQVPIPQVYLQQKQLESAENIKKSSKHIKKNTEKHIKKNTVKLPKNQDSEQKSVKKLKKTPRLEKNDELRKNFKLHQILFWEIKLYLYQWLIVFLFFALYCIAITSLFIYKIYPPSLKIHKSETRIYENHTSQGDHFYKLKKYNKALNEYTKAIQKDSSISPIVYSNRGNVYYELKLYQSAIDDYTKAIESDPHNPVFYGNRGTVYKVLEKYSEALADFEKVMVLGDSEMKQTAKLQIEILRTLIKHENK